MCATVARLAEPNASRLRLHDVGDLVPTRPIVLFEETRMTEPNSADPPRADRRAELSARNEAMREQIAQMLTDLQSRTEGLKDAQAAAAAATGTATSKDGLVIVTVDSAGVLTELRLAPSAFDRSTPDKLAREITQVTQQAAAAVREQVRHSLAPLQKPGPDLPELVPGAPSLRGLVPPEPPRPTTPTTRPTTTHRRDDGDDRSVLTEEPW